MNPKLIEERYPRYFGPEELHDGTVRRIVADREKIVQELCDMAAAFYKADPEAFDNFWYEKACSRCGSRSRTMEGWCVVTSGARISRYCSKCSKEIGIG